jgi:hypothetical protein
MVPRPLDATEDEWLEMIAKAVEEPVFTASFIDRLRALISRPAT